MITMFRKMSMNPHPSKGYISKFQIGGNVIENVFVISKFKYYFYTM